MKEPKPLDKETQRYFDHWFEIYRNVLLEISDAPENEMPAQAEVRAAAITAAIIQLAMCQTETI